MTGTYAPGSRGAARSWPEVALGGVHLLVLWSFAIVQPLFSDLGRNAEFFVARGNTGADILLFAFVLVLLVPAGMLLAEVGATFFGPATARTVHLAFVGVLAALLAIGLLKRVLPDTSAVLLPLTVLAGAAAAVGYMRVAALRSLLTVLCIAPFVFLVSFLVFSPVSQLLDEDEGSAAVAALAASRTPVALVIFDELPTISLMDAERRIDARRLPSFGRLAATSTWYRNATTVSDGSYVAVPAILTGRRPAQRLPTSKEYPDSVFTLLGASHAIHALEPVTHVCPQSLCGRRERDAAGERLGSLASDLTLVAAHLVLPGDIADSLPPIDRNYEDFAGEDKGVSTDAGGAALPGGRRIAGTDEYSDLLRGMEGYVADVRPRPGGLPPLYVAHFEVPHVPWRVLPSGRQYPIAGTTLPGLHDQTWTKDSRLVAQATQRHLLQVGYADRLLGRMIQRLRAAGVWDDALVIVTADHGVGLQPGGSRRAVTHANFAGIAGVPLFVKLPRQRRAAIADTAARTVDIMPTIAAVTGTKPKAELDGHPLSKPLPAVTPSVRNGRRGRFVSLPLADFVRARDKELARQRRLFPDPLDLLHLRGDGVPIGRSVRTLPSAPAGASSATIERASEFRSVSPGSGVLPVYVAGHFESGGDEGLTLAFAVNGRIVAGGRSYWVGESARFSALIPASSLRAGANTVSVFLVRAGTFARVAHTGG